MSTPPNSEQEDLNKHEESVERISWRYLRSLVLSFLQLEYGLLYTAKEMLLRPGTAIRNYLLTSEREKFTNPLTFAILTAAAMLFISVQLGDMNNAMSKYIESGAASNADILADSTQIDSVKIDSILVDSTLITQIAIDSLASDSTATNIDFNPENFIETYTALYTKYYNIIMILSIPGLAFFSKLIFRKEDFSYTEHIVANTFIMGMMNMIAIPLSPFMYKYTGLFAVYFVISILYQIFAYVSWFKYTKNKIVKGFAAALLGFIGYIVVYVLLMIAAIIVLVLIL